MHHHHRVCPLLAVGDASRVRATCRHTNVAHQRKNPGAHAMSAPELEWQSLPSPFEGLETWGLRLPNGTSLVVTFDHEYPDMGWRASYRRPYDPTTHYLDRFDSMLVAMGRVIEVAQCA